MKQTARILKALSDETRLRILALLLEAGELCVCDLMAVLQLPQSTVSRHLAYLKNSGWVNDRREGIWMYYTIARHTPGPVAELAPLLYRLLAAEDQATEDRSRLEESRRGRQCR